MSTERLSDAQVRALREVERNEAAGGKLVGRPPYLPPRFQTLYAKALVRRGFPDTHRLVLTDAGHQALNDNRVERGERCTPNRR